MYIYVSTSYLKLLAFPPTGLATRMAEEDPPPPQELLVILAPMATAWGWMGISEGFTSPGFVGISPWNIWIFLEDFFVG